jgi:hypothetical protein
VDEIAIVRIIHAESLRMRVLSPDKNFSLNALLRRIDRVLEAGGEETFEVQLESEKFDKLVKPGTVVFFKNGLREASFAVSGVPAAPAFQTENPLIEGAITIVSDEKEWL